MDNELEQIFESYTGVDALRAVVDLIRPDDGASRCDIDARVRELIGALDRQPDLLGQFDAAVIDALDRARLLEAFAESGIVTTRGFLRDFKSRLTRKVLPKSHSRDATRLLVERIFSERDDWRWLTRSSLEVWAELFALMSEHTAWVFPHTKIDRATRGLAGRIAALGIDEELNAKLQAVDHYDSTFLDITALTDTFLASAGDNTDPEAFEQLFDCIEKCRNTIRKLRRNKRQVGTNFRLTRISRRLLQQLDRLELLIQLRHPTSPIDSITCAARLFRNLVESEKKAVSLRLLISESTDLVSFQIADQNARKGHKYITDRPNGYWAFLRSALTGGAIVAPFAMLKVVAADFPLSLAAEAAFYSLNYAVCFVLLYLTGSILATKQPSVLAAAIARKIDEATTHDEALEGTADVIILAWRSQFVSFVGNLGAAIPLGFLIAWGVLHFLGTPVVSESGAEYLLDRNHPWASATLLYAGIAGVALFLSGLLGGAVDNWMDYREVRRRIAEHPGLQFLGDLRRKAGAFLSKHLGMLTGNVALGVMLGCAGPLGVILGLPFDIRHIAFSSAEVGAAAFTIPEVTAPAAAAVAFAGIIGIGFMNFIVSFTLSLKAGLDARGMTLGDGGRLVRILLLRALRRPWQWVLPVATPRYELPEEFPPG